MLKSKSKQPHLDSQQSHKAIEKTMTIIVDEVLNYLKDIGYDSKSSLYTYMEEMKNLDFLKRGALRLVLNRDDLKDDEQKFMFILEYLELDKHLPTCKEKRKKLLSLCVQMKEHI